MFIVFLILVYIYQCIKLTKYPDIILNSLICSVFEPLLNCGPYFSKIKYAIIAKASWFILFFILTYIFILFEFNGFVICLPASISVVRSLRDIMLHIKRLRTAHAERARFKENDIYDINNDTDNIEKERLKIMCHAHLFPIVYQITGTALLLYMCR